MQFFRRKMQCKQYPLAFRQKENKKETQFESLFAIFIVVD